MNLLLIGSGGREHALALALSQSPRLTSLFIAPGNPGTAQLGTNVVLDVTNPDAVIAFCHVQRVEFVVIGPEGPLVAGLVDALERAGVKAFGPSKAAAQLEGSKGFTKDLCAEFNIPTAAYQRFGDKAAALAFVQQQGAPIVIKADGLAAGKGVVVAMTLAEAEAALEMIFSGTLGEAGAEVVVEAFLEGEEVSFFALCDGKRAVYFASAQDHKRAFDGDLGPNTGGMGAYSPAPIMTPDMEARVMHEIIQPTLTGMAARGTPFKGVLFAGLMLTQTGPQLIEYNVRFGDPETQVLLLRLQEDLLGLLLACASGTLNAAEVKLSPQSALTVVFAAQGYPGAYEKGTEIGGLEQAVQVPGVTIFHAGTAVREGKLVATGGRVLNITAMAADVASARLNAYAALEKIDWPQGFYRKDIAWRALVKP
jgi:phosphoribosylamine---glycine ligase